ncbi:hypothetical protein SLS62_007128 [Diatrype stigma]|uniref:Uncharacterized protein n=1 Tax=Diatrype stigma TaxID=117547 RepID=A0AAN9YR41_9PEZI
MSDTPDDGGPPLLRPIPRRPFSLNIQEPTPPEDEDEGENSASDGQQFSKSPEPNRSASASPPRALRSNGNSSRSHLPPALNLETLNSRLLNSSSRSKSNRSHNHNHYNATIATPGSEGVFPPGSGGVGGNPSSSSSISRAQSILNLTGSTLMGIYTPNTYGPDRMSSLLTDGGSGTPWGTGAETPARLDDDNINNDDEGEDDEGFSGEDGDDDDEYDDETEGEREMRRRRRSSMHAAEVMGRRRASLLQHARPPPFPPLSPSLEDHQQQRQQYPPLHLPPAPSPFSVSALPALVLRLAPRALLLSALGVLYGILVARLLDRFRPSSTTTTNCYDWKYMAFWGVSGVVLGGLLPWFDGVWDRATALGGGGGGRQQQQQVDDGESAIAVNGGRRRQKQRRRSARTSSSGMNQKVDGGVLSGAGVGGAGGAFGGSPLSTLSGKGQGEGAMVEEAAVPGPDWSLAVRGIGAFAGIAFAIRKLAWDSTFQVSVTLALVNPVLWYLIDRSVPGLLMAGAVGICGSALFMAPLTSSSSLAVFSPWAYLLDPSGGVSGDWNAEQREGFNASSSSYPSSPLSLLHTGGAGVGIGAAGNAGLGSDRRHALETAVWMLSVLFCCCVCFGNIGRWLALMSRSKNNSSNGGGNHNRARSGSISAAVS